MDRHAIFRHVAVLTLDTTYALQTITTLTSTWLAVQQKYNESWDTFKMIHQRFLRIFRTRKYRSEAKFSTNTDRNWLGTTVLRLLFFSTS